MGAKKVEVSSLLKGSEDGRRKRRRRSSTTARAQKRRTHISSQLCPIPPEVLSEQSDVSSIGVSEEDRQVVLEELWEILSVEVVEELEEKEESLGELREGSGRRELIGGEGEELVGSL